MGKRPSKPAHVGKAPADRLGDDLLAAFDTALQARAHIPSGAEMFHPVGTIIVFVYWVGFGVGLRLDPAYKSSGLAGRDDILQIVVFRRSRMPPPSRTCPCWCRIGANCRFAYRILAHCERSQTTFTDSVSLMHRSKQTGKSLEMNR